MPRRTTTWPQPKRHLRGKKRPRRWHRLWASTVAHEERLRKVAHL